MITVEIVLAIVASLVGVPAATALLIDVLKWAGVVDDGNAGKFSAAINLIALIVVAAALQFFPSFDITSADAALLEVAKFAALIFQYIIQIAATKTAHKLFMKTPLRTLSVRG